MKRLVIAGVGMLCACAMTWAQDYTLLKTFSGGNGRNPIGTLLVDGGKVYGMTQDRDPGLGTIFSMDLSGSNFVNLHNFPDSYSVTDGAAPYGDLIRVGDSLFGMTYYGGANQPATGSGVIFRLDMDGTDYTLLHTFTGSTTDGANPYGSLSFVGGQLYGMTYSGGASNTGTLFQIGTNGADFSVVHSFAGTGGSRPYGDLVSFGDRFYGLTSYEGSNNNGVVFSIGTNGGDYSVLHYFRGGSGDGSRPMGSLSIADGVLYGMTENGGSNGNRGTIFRLDPDGSDFSTIYNFAGIGVSNASDPYYSDLVVLGDTLYGMTLFGGSNNYGALFEINTNGSEFLVLHSFRGGTQDGRYPYGGLAYDDGVLYGMTANGGSGDIGTIFAYTIPEPSGWVALALLSAVAVIRARRRR